MVERHAEIGFREKIHKDLQELFDITINAFADEYEEPEFDGEKDKNGKILYINFSNVPERVIQSVIHSTLNGEGKIPCEYAIHCDFKNEGHNWIVMSINGFGLKEDINEMVSEIFRGSRTSTPI